METQGWIKLHRKMKDWEWFSDLPTLGVFMHLVLGAQYSDTKFRGIDINRGQIVIGRKKFSISCGITEQRLRTILKRLEDTGSITIKPTNKYSVVTICNYDKYQCDIEGNQPTNQPADNKQINQQITNKSTSNQPHSKKERSKEIEEDKNNSGTPIFNFKSSLLDLGIEPKLVADYMAVRKTKKATNTETAFNHLMATIAKSGMDPEEVIRIATEHSWASVEVSWLKREKGFINNIKDDSKRKGTDVPSNPNYEKGF